MEQAQPTKPERRRTPPSSSCLDYVEAIFDIACMITAIVIANIFFLVADQRLNAECIWYVPDYTLNTSVPAGMCMHTEFNTRYNQSTDFRYVTIAIFTYVSVILAGASATAIFTLLRTCCACVDKFVAAEDGGTPVPPPVRNTTMERSVTLRSWKIDSNDGFLYQFSLNVGLYVFFGPLCFYLLGFKSGPVVMFGMAAFLLLALVFYVADIALDELCANMDSGNVWPDSPLVSSLPPVLASMYVMCVAGFMKVAVASVNMAAAPIPPGILGPLGVFLGLVVLQSTSFVVTFFTLWIQGGFQLEWENFAVDTEGLRTWIKVSTIVLQIGSTVTMCTFLMLLQKYALSTYASGVLIM